MLAPTLNQLIENNDLSQLESKHALDAILNGASPEQISAFLALMQVKGVTADELTGMAAFLRENMIKVSLPFDVLDIVGTGGDAANTVNISTAAAIVVASCNFPVVKHGSHASTSMCGSADFMMALGAMGLDDPVAIQAAVEKHRFGFCYAPAFHPALKAIKVIRTSLGFKTVFNLLGPLLNPASAQYYVFGVSSENEMQLMALCLINLGVKRALVVHGSGLDELNCLGMNKVIEIKNNEISEYELDPRLIGLDYSTLADIQGGNAAKNVMLIRDALSGENKPIRDTIVINAAAGLYVVGKVSTIKDGVKMAGDAIDNRNALSLFMRISK